MLKRGRTLLECSIPSDAMARSPQGPSDGRWKYIPQEWEEVTRLAIVDAPIDSSGAGRGEEHAPAALRAAGLLQRLGARDAGEADARIRDRRREPITGVVGASEVPRSLGGDRLQGARGPEER